MINRLKSYEIRENTLTRFSNYLDDRCQYVTVNELYSDRALITRGIPQGSILGPLLFLIYINDIINRSKSPQFILFADDANLF